MKIQTDQTTMAIALHRRLPDHVRDYLIARGVTESQIHRYRIGWNGRYVTMPVTNQDRRVVFFKFFHGAPHASGDLASPVPRYSGGSYPELFGWERILWKPKRLVVTDNEFDRLVAEARGFPAICSTHPDIFLPSWMKALIGVPEIAICFSPENRELASDIAKSIPNAVMVDLEMWWGIESIQEFFVVRQHVREDFAALLDIARNLSEKGELGDETNSVPHGK